MIYLIQTDLVSFIPSQEAIAHEPQLQHAEFPMYRSVGLHRTVQGPTLCQYGIGLKFKDLLFSIFSGLNEVS